MGVAKSVGAFLLQQQLGGASSGPCRQEREHNTSPRWRRWPLGFESPLRAHRPLASPSASVFCSLGSLAFKMPKSGEGSPSTLACFFHQDPVNGPVPGGPWH